MIDHKADVALLGAGFSGSLMALVLSKMGISSMLIERGEHPRFAIGESSTPVANLVLEQLARRYELPQLAPLATWGAWQRSYPQLACGLKRGFSYFWHAAGRPFEVRGDHARELLVAASAADEDADTHWYRADFDRFLMQEAVAAGSSYFDRTEIVHIEQAASGGWTLHARTRDGAERRFGARFLIDASGDGGVLARQFGISREPASLATNSRSIFCHVRGLRSWHDLLASREAPVQDHVYRCDDAALHHVFDGGWYWVLPFNNGIVSVGVTVDGERHPLDPEVPVEVEWRQWLERFPSVAEQFANVQIVDPPGGLRRTGRLQRRAKRAVGPGWAMLPNTACFFDPLHSTGNAHALCGIERLLATLGEFVSRDPHDSDFLAALAQYEGTLAAEIEVLDRIIHGSYAALGNFAMFAEFTMFYFAAATVSESRRRKRPAGPHGAFLLADDAEYRAALDRLYRRLLELTPRGATPSPDAAAAFCHEVALAIRPWNIAGLCDPAKRNMYPFTG